MSTLGFSWKKTKERNRKIVYFIFFEKKKIARAATLAEIPSKIRGHLEKLKLSVGSSSAGAGYSSPEDLAKAAGGVQPQRQYGGK